MCASAAALSRKAATAECRFNGAAGYSTELFRTCRRHAPDDRRVAVGLAAHAFAAYCFGMAGANTRYGRPDSRSGYDRFGRSAGDFIRSNYNSIGHPVGTAKMGPDSDQEAVLDQYCRVRGVEGLRVVDASVMPN